MFAGKMWVCLCAGLLLLLFELGGGGGGFKGPQKETFNWGRCLPDVEHSIKDWPF